MLDGKIFGQHFCTCPKYLLGKIFELKKIEEKKILNSKNFRRKKFRTERILKNFGQKKTSDYKLFRIKFCPNSFLSEIISVRNVSHLM